MSKHMQLTVVVRPHKDLSETYPKLARYLGRSDAALVEQNPSLYALTGQLDKLLYHHEGTRLREVLLRHREKLRDLHKRVEEHIANWNLAQADRLLYDMEDVFDDIESELD